MQVLCKSAIKVSLDNGTEISIDPNDPRLNRLFGDQDFLNAATIRGGTITIYIARPRKPAEAKNIGEAMYCDDPWFKADDKPIISAEILLVKVGNWEASPLPAGKKPNKIFAFATTLEADWMQVAVRLTDGSARALGPFIMLPFQPPTEQPAIAPPPSESEPAADDTLKSAPEVVDVSATTDTIVPPPADAVLDRHIDTLDLSVRAANCLQNAGITTIRGIVERGLDSLLAKKQIGKKTYNELVEVLAGLGIVLEPDEEPPSSIEGFSAEDVENLVRRVDELELSPRAANCLQIEGCEYIFQAVERIRPEGKLLTKKSSPGSWPKNFGRHSYNEFDDVVRELGLQPGMRFTDSQRAELLRLALGRHNARMG